MSLPLRRWEAATSYHEGSMTLQLVLRLALTPDAGLTTAGLGRQDHLADHR